jgi:hypothetical protein
VLHFVNSKLQTFHIVVKLRSFRPAIEIYSLSLFASLFMLQGATGRASIVHSEAVFGEVLRLIVSIFLTIFSPSYCFSSHSRPSRSFALKTLQSILIIYK